MKLKKFEQSGFILETEKGFRAAFDVGTMTSLEKLEGIAPVDLFIVSHIHGDHFSPDHIAKFSPKTVILSRECYEVLSPTTTHLPAGVPTPWQIGANYVISEEGLVYETDDIKVLLFHVDHGPNVSVPVDNFGFLITADNRTVYFAGDMFNPSGVDTGGLEVDYALIPVGGFYTFGPGEAVAFAKTFKKIGKAIPMHNRGDVLKTDEFLTHLGTEVEGLKMEE